MGWGGGLWTSVLYRCGEGGAFLPSLLSSWLQVWARYGVGASDAGAAALVVGDEVLVGRARGLGVGLSAMAVRGAWWPFCDSRWHQCGGPSWPVRTMKATPMGVVSFLKASIQLLVVLHVASRENLDSWIRRWWCYGVAPFLKVPPWSTQLVVHGAYIISVEAV